MASTVDEVHVTNELFGGPFTTTLAAVEEGDLHESSPRVRTLRNCSDLSLEEKRGVVCLRNLVYRWSIGMEIEVIR